MHLSSFLEINQKTVHRLNICIVGKRRCVYDDLVLNVSTIKCRLMWSIGSGNIFVTCQGFAVDIDGSSCGWMHDVVRKPHVLLAWSSPTMGISTRSSPYTCPAVMAMSIRVPTLPDRGEFSCRAWSRRHRRAKANSRQISGAICIFLCAMPGIRAIVFILHTKWDCCIVFTLHIFGVYLNYYIGVIGGK